jgi:hypothetical protein
MPELRRGGMYRGFDVTVSAMPVRATEPAAGLSSRYERGR